MMQLEKILYNLNQISSATYNYSTEGLPPGYSSAFQISYNYAKEFNKASFDKIISYGVIHLLDDSEKVIRRIYELLKPDGLFISTTACLKDKMALKNRLEFSAYLLINKLGLFPLHLNMFRTYDVEKLIVSQNFRLDKAEKIFHGITISFIVARKQ